MAAAAAATAGSHGAAEPEDQEGDAEKHLSWAGQKGEKGGKEE